MKWRKNKFDETDRNTRILTTINNDLHQKNYIDGLCELMTKGVKDSILCKTSAVNNENILGWYVKHHIEPPIIDAWAKITVPSSNLTQLQEFKKERERQQKEN